MTPEVREWIERCWAKGFSIIGTKNSLAKKGWTATTEEIRRVFADLAS